MTRLEQLHSSSPLPIGETHRRFETEGFVCTEASQLPNSSYTRHYHDHAYLDLVFKGSYENIAGRTKLACLPFSMIVMPAGAMHATEYGGEGCRSLIVEVRRDRLNPWLNGTRLFDELRHSRGFQTSTITARIKKEIHTFDSFSPMVIEGLVLELIAELSRGFKRPVQRRAPQWLEQAREFVHDHLDRTCRLSQIAEIAGVHPVHLAREFKNYFGCTVGEYLRQIRIERACKLLADDRLSLADISLLTGFTDQAHFSKAFRRLIGITPSNFRSMGPARKKSGK